MARRQAGDLDGLTTWPILPLPMPGRPFSICAVTTRPQAFMRFVLHNTKEIRHSRSPSPTLLLRSSLTLDLLCKSPKPKFVKAQCRVSVPKMRSSMLPGGSSNIRGARGHSRSTPHFFNVSHWDTGAVNVQGREAHMVARQIESTRSRPLVPEPSHPPHQGRRKRNALHATAQIHPSSWRRTEIATSAPPSASNPAHCPSHFSALAPPDTEVDESEFPLCRGMGVNFCSSTTRRSSRRRLPHGRRHAATRSTEVHLATLSLLSSFHLMLPNASRMIIHLL